MKNINLTTYRQDWMTTTDTTNSSRFDFASERAMNLATELFCNGARFVTNGADGFMLMHDEIVHMECPSDLNSFLRRHRYLLRGRRLSNTLHDFFLMEVYDDLAVTLQARLIALGEYEGSRDVTLSASDIPATKSLIESLLKKHGTKLTEQDMEY